MPDSMTPAEAQARINEIYADPSHPSHSLDTSEALDGSEELRGLWQIAAGRAGERILEESVFATTPHPSAPGLPPDQQAVINGMIVDELAARAPELQNRFGVSISEARLRGFAQAMTPRPDTMPLRVEDALRAHPPAVRGELQYLAGLGWQALQDSGIFSLSATIEGEKGARFAPGFFEWVAEVGAHVRDQREAKRRSK